MNAEALLSAMKDYGADMAGAMNRFLDDMELYETCLDMFLEDENFAALQSALAAGDCAAAFSAAHTLKGVAANLGVTPILRAICALVEPLRAGHMEGLEPALAEALAERARLAAILRGESASAPTAPAAPAEDLQ